MGKRLDIKNTLIFFLTLIWFTPNAQNYTETQWFFGASEGNLQFDKNGLQFYEESRMNSQFGTGGPAAVSDELTGNILFYSDGQNIYDGSHQPMMGAVALNGDNSINQSAVALKRPASLDTYYLFTNSGESGVNEIQYAEIDLSRSGNGNAFEPYGEVVSANNPTGLVNPSEAMIVLGSKLPNTYWLVSQDQTTLDFLVTTVTNVGVGGTMPPVNLQTPTDNPEIEASAFAFNPFTSELAVAPKSANRNVLILNFNDTTGVLSFNRTITNTGYNDGQGESVYDLEWSNDGSKLYISRFGSSDSTVANVYQHDVTDSLFQSVLPVLPSPIFRSFGLQAGMDGYIYHLYQEVDGGPTEVGRFEQIDSLAADVIYIPQYFDQDFNGRQFPAFAPSNFDQYNSIDFVSIGNCDTDNILFFAKVDPTPNTILWDFGDGSFATGPAPIHTYQQGTHNVTMYAELNGYVDIVQKSIQITQNTLMLDIVDSLMAVVPDDTVICVDETLLLDAGDMGTSYQWSTGETSQTIEIDTAGTYWVQVTSGACSSYDVVNVTEYGITRNVGSQWYFGERAGLDFNTLPPTALDDDNQMNSLEGCSSISDLNGNLLFYTNGKTVWNKDHEIMTILDTTSFEGLGSNDIGGDSTSTQGVMILPFMDDETLFYIFTSQEIYGEVDYHMKYSIVDVKADSARGAVVLRNLPLFDNAAEMVTSTGFQNSAWLLTHEFGNNSFRSNFVDASGISTTIFSPAGEVMFGNNKEEGEGTVKFNLGLSLAATTNPGSGNLEIFGFDQGSGRLSDTVLVDTEESGLYGLEWSGDGQKIYVTTDSKLIQYDLDSLGTDDRDIDIASSKYDGYANGTGYGSLQRGSNGQIYLAVDNSQSLHVLTTPGGDNDQAGFSQNAQDLLGRTSRRGLPNFTQTASGQLTTPGLTFTPGCFGQQTDFFATGTSVIDEFFWTFDSAATNLTETGMNVSTIYNQTGVHPIELLISNRCGYMEVFLDTLDVFSIPETPQIPSEANLCNDDIQLEAWFEDRADLNYVWLTGEPPNQVVFDTSRVITVSNRDIIDVAIINSDGCSSDTVEIFVGDNRPFIDLGIDRTVCEDEPGLFLDANTTGVEYNWEVNGSVIGTDTTRFLPIDTSVPGQYEFILSVTETSFGCTQIDTVQFLIQETPAINTATTSPSNCGLSDASISFDITNSGSFDYSLFGDSLSTTGFINGPDSSPLFDLLPAGNYQLYVENIVSGCTTLDPIVIQDDVPFDVSASNLPECLVDVNLQIAVTGLAIPDVVNVYVSDLVGDTIFTENNLLVPVQQFPMLDSGLYFVAVEDISNNCIRADTVHIEPYLPGVTDCDPLIVAPNAFSPNGNGQNEFFFIIPNPFIDNFEIFIYSRWGELVYYSQDQGFRWNGDFRNDELGPGTFSYVMKFTSLEEPEKGTQTQFGSVTILK